MGTITVQYIVPRICNQALALFGYLRKNWKQSLGAEGDGLGCGCFWYIVRHFCTIVWRSNADHTLS